MRKPLLFAGLVFLCPFFLQAQERPIERVELTLRDCLLKALEENLDIAVQAIEPEISSFSLRQQKDIYWPQLSLGYFNYNYNYLTNWAVQGVNYLDRTYRYNIGVTQKIFTGGELQLSLLTSSSDTTRALTLVNPSYSGEFSLDFTQPLLKGFGSKMANMEIKKAQNRLDISVIGLKSGLLQKVYEVEEAYWNLVDAIENLKVYELTLSQSQERLRREKEGARTGIKSSLDVLRTETEVANYENSVLSARAQVAIFEDRLKGLLNFPPEGLGSLKALIPSDSPGLEKVDLSFEEALKTAYAESPELEKSLKEIESTKLDVSYQKNQLLPQLDLRASLWYPGQSGDILVYKDNDPYTGEVVDKIKGSRIDSFKDVFNLKYKNWYVTLNLTVPLDSIFSRAGLAQARLEEEKKLLERKKLEQTIYYDVLEAYKEMKNREEQIETAFRYRELTETRLRAEEERYNLGLVGNEWLFQYQRDLATARVSEIRAKISYQVAVAKLEETMGVSLKKKGLKFKEYQF
ncbi:MAG: TolC family protein [Candidatus Aminicenantales bacterium]